jgi:hypothetical protein
VAKITRPTITQATTGGDVETVFIDVVSKMRVMVKTKRSGEKLVSGAFRALDGWEIWFQNPGYHTEILQGDHITVNFRGVDREFIIEGYFPASWDHDDFYVTCEREVTKTAC